MYEIVLLKYLALTVCDLVPSLAEIRLKLSEREIQQGNLSGSVSTITEGLAIERSQYVVESI
jgi:hypothetical protein